MVSSMSKFKKIGEININFKSLALTSIFVYIVAALTFETADILNITFLSSIALYLCLGCCLLYCIYTRTIRTNFIIWGLIIFGIVISLATTNTPAKEEASSILYRYWTSFILVFMMNNVVSTHSDITVLIYAFIIGGMGLSVAIISYNGIDIILSGGDRMSNGTFGNVNAIGTHCGRAILLAIYELITRMKQRCKGRKIFLISAIVICFLVMMFTGSRKALLSIVFSLIVFTLVYSNDKNFILRVLSILFVFSVLIFIISTVPAFNAMKERMLGLLDVLGDSSNASVAGDAKRIYFLEKGIETFLESPVFGKGLCYSIYLFDMYSHNNYVELLMNTGIIGFVSFYWMYIYLIFKNSNVKHNNIALYSLIWMLMAKMLFDEIGVVDHYDRMTFVVLIFLALCLKVGLTHKDNKFDL